MQAIIQVTLYTKDPCPLCDEVKEALDALQAAYPHTLTEIDITQDTDTFAYYRYIIPVVKIGERTLKAPIRPLDLQDALRVVSVKKAPEVIASGASGEE